MLLPFPYETWGIRCDLQLVTEAGRGEGTGETWCREMGESDLPEPSLRTCMVFGPRHPKRSLEDAGGLLLVPTRGEETAHPSPDNDCTAGQRLWLSW